MAVLFESAGGGLVSAVTGVEEAGDAGDGGEADARDLADFAVGDFALQGFDDGPAVGHGLELCRGAQVSHEGSDFVGGAQGRQRYVQVPLGQGFLALGNVVVGFHGRPLCSNVLIH